MKFSSVIVLLVSFVLFQRVSAISIQDALKQKLISINILSYEGKDDGNFHPSFYNQCIIFEIKNLQSTSLLLVEEPGRFLMPDDTSQQRMMITATLSFALPAHQIRQQPVFAMCTEAHDGSPGTNTRFDYGAVAGGNLLLLSQMIAKKNWQNNAAQAAIWCLTDDFSPYTISSEDTGISNTLRKYVCTLKGIHFDPQMTASGIELPHFRHVTGKFHYTLAKTHRISIKIFNQEGQLIKELAPGESQAAGIYDYDYDVDIPVNDDRHPPAVIVKFYLDGELLSEKKHVLSQR